ncbi:MAG TPA: methyltransferase domain-containing protein [Arcobacter sp.]|nr:methyltransferase domain-containing protein [Arcobacter sp.]HIP56247.1 methyltransferase domain-containing protein [Arcobacter sp.]
MIKFKDENLYTKLDILQKEFSKLKAKEILEFEIQNPNYKVLVDIGQIYYCKMLTPKIINENTIIARYEKLNQNESFHKDTKDEEKYGVNSTFASIKKNEQASFLHYYKQALKNVNINKRTKILNLGVNSGDEFEVIKNYASNFENLELLGIDYSQSAIYEAQNNFKQKNISFICANINELYKLNLEEFDLIITIGTLQSSNIEFNILFQDIVQKYLKKTGAMILGFPNCRWIDGEMIYGAKAKNYQFPESSLLYKDVMFCKKYLQQKKYRVTITGKDYIFLTATSIR